MKITEVYPKGGINKIQEPLNLEVAGLNLPGITILGRTWTRDGAEITIFYNGEQMMNHNYDYHRSLSYQYDMARDTAEDINIIFEMNRLSVLVTKDDLLPVMKQIRDKCESRYGNHLPNSDYEILVSFLATSNF